MNKFLITTLPALMIFGTGTIACTLFWFAFGPSDITILFAPLVSTILTVFLLWRKSPKSIIRGGLKGLAVVLISLTLYGSYMSIKTIVLSNNSFTNDPLIIHFLKIPIAVLFFGFIPGSFIGFIAGIATSIVNKQLKKNLEPSNTTNS